MRRREWNAKKSDVTPRQIIGLRAALRLSQTRFALAVGLSAHGGRVSVQRWEAGTVRPSDASQRRIVELAAKHSVRI